MTNKSQVLTTTNLPMYSIQTFLRNYILVAGGGGSSKTGITNGFEVYKICKDGKSLTMRKVIRHDSGPCVIMNNCCYKNGSKIYIICNEDDKCRQYTADIILEPSFGNGKTTKELNFQISTGRSLVTDFNEDEPLQRIVKVNSSGNIMVTGGTDGCIRLWNFPIKEDNNPEPLKVFTGHTKEIDDIDISSDGASIASVAKDGQAFHWNTVTNTKSNLLHPTNKKQIFKRCRFGIINDKPTYNIYTIANGPNQKSFLQRWSYDNKIIYEFQFAEPTSALAVREDGLYIAVGTMFSGSVSIHEAYDLKMIYSVKQAHAMFVTGLEFLNKDFVPETKAAVLSISVDNRICFHNVPCKTLVSFWKLFIIIHFILLLFYIIIFNS
ncbi:prolactin regulatory element-binding protein [Adelges cooleyi]|uniref:prolactin regulatory element-binding protein n=1 Tax=Adelges cooleyi TaxID=133065 RepID=UPI00217FE170|nr:prolactin regulatory element-binding protein [Adelges cooleyi]